MYNIAEKVNEGGGSGGGGVLVVHAVIDEDDGSRTLSKTWQEIHDAMLAGGAVLAVGEDDAVCITGAFPGENNYVVSLGGNTYSSPTKSGYPTSD